MMTERHRLLRRLEIERRTARRASQARIAMHELQNESFFPINIDPQEPKKAPPSIITDKDNLKPKEFQRGFVETAPKAA